MALTTQEIKDINRETLNTEIDKYLTTNQLSYQNYSDEWLKGDFTHVVFENWPDTTLRYDDGRPINNKGMNER